MGNPDTPGLVDQQWVDHLTDDDLDTIAQELQREEAEIRFIKGFVKSRDKMEGSTVEELRKKIMEDYASSVFCGRTTGNSQKEGNLGKQK